MNRRSFLGIGSLLACGTALSPASLFATAPRPLRGGLPLSATDESILAFVRGYSSSIRIIGASVLGRIRTSGYRTLHLLVEISSPEQVTAALTSVPFSGVYAQGNNLLFTVGEIDVIIENLLPEAFAARLAALAKKAGVAYAHDGLVYDPATNILTDPFSGRTGGLRVVNKSFGDATALEIVLRGIAEAGQLGIGASQGFIAWKTAVLRQIARLADSPALAKKFVQQLALLADQLRLSAFVYLLRTRLISTALRQAFGIEVTSAIAEYHVRRAATGGEVPNSAVWLAVLLAPEIESNETDGAATTWIQGGDRFSVLRSRQALKLARKLL